MAECHQQLGFKSTWVKGPLSWFRLCFDSREGSFCGLSVLTLILFQSKKQQQCTTLASSIQNSKMQYWKQNHICSPPVYIIRTMIRRCISWIILPSTLVIGSLQLDMPLACGLGCIYCKLPLTLVSGSIFAPYHGLYTTYTDNFSSSTQVWGSVWLPQIPVICNASWHSLNPQKLSMPSSSAAEYWKEHVVKVNLWTKTILYGTLV